MSLIPLFICIFSLIIYAICKKQFFDFMDLEKDEGQELQEIVAIQEIQDNQNNQIEILKKNDNFNITFNENQIFQGETDILKNKEIKEENEEDEKIDQEKKHEDIMNEFTLKLNLNPNSNSSNKIINRPIIEQKEDSDIEGYELIINSMKEKDENNINNESFHKSNRKKEIKNIEMKMIDSNEDNKENKDNKDNKDN